MLVFLTLRNTKEVGLVQSKDQDRALPHVTDIIQSFVCEFYTYCTKHGETTKENIEYNQTNSALTFTPERTPVVETLKSR